MRIRSMRAVLPRRVMPPDATNTEKVGKVTRAQVEEIAQAKMPDLTASDLEAAVRTIAGSARSAGIEVEGL